MSQIVWSDAMHHLTNKPNAVREGGDQAAYVHMNFLLYNILYEPLKSRWMTWQRSTVSLLQQMSHTRSQHYEWMLSNKHPPVAWSIKMPLRLTGGEAIHE